MIVNSVLLSSVMFFASIWGGTERGVKKVTSAIQNYLWSGTMHRARTKVAWTQCCLSKDKGGINVINPKDALVALMVKWILKACEPGESNLYLILRYRLSLFQPYQGGRWEASLEYFTLPNIQARQSSAAWTRAGKAWKKLSPDLHPIRPQNREEVLSEPFWWSRFLPQIGAGFSKLRASHLHRRGLRCVRDALSGGQFLQFDDAVQKFQLLAEEQGAWTAAGRALQNLWGGMLYGPTSGPAEGEWIGWFATEVATEPLAVMCVLPDQGVSLGGQASDWVLPATFTTFVVQRCLGACATFELVGTLTQPSKSANVCMALLTGSGWPALNVDPGKTQCYCILVVLTCWPGTRGGLPGEVQMTRSR